VYVYISNVTIMFQLCFNGAADWGGDGKAH